MVGMGGGRLEGVWVFMARRGRAENTRRGALERGDGVFQFRYPTYL